MAIDRSIWILYSGYHWFYGATSFPCQAPSRRTGASVVSEFCLPSLYEFIGQLFFDAWVRIADGTCHQFWSCAVLWNGPLAWSNDCFLANFGQKRTWTGLFQPACRRCVSFIMCIFERNCWTTSRSASLNRVKIGALFPSFADGHPASITSVIVPLTVL